MKRLCGCVILKLYSRVYQMLLNSNEKITVYTPLKQTAKARLELIRVKILFSDCRY